MNFYIGNSIEKLNFNNKNVELDDELMEYLYSIKKTVPFITFFTIDPYSDTVLGKNNISDIISMCDYVIKEQKLNDYVESEDIISTMKELNNLCHNALKQNKMIIVIGD